MDLTEHHRVTFGPFVEESFTVPEPILVESALPFDVWQQPQIEPVEEDTITIGCIQDISSLPSEPNDREGPREPCPWPQVSNEELTRRKEMPHREETPCCCCCRSLFRKQNPKSGEEVPLQETRSARMATDVESDSNDGPGTSSSIIQREAGITDKEGASESEKREFGISQACVLECGYLAADTHTHAHAHTHTHARTHI